MCGIAGLISTKETLSREVLSASIKGMTDKLYHRGPDDEGYFEDAGPGIALGHRRLSIIDLSEQGHQPMHSSSGRYVLAYNGEVYNFRALRHELEGAGIRFRGHSDTEVLLEGVEHWGLIETLRKANGMFALSLWDRSDRVLILARDRAGKKPLYYGFGGQYFAFASELKAMRSLPNFDCVVSPDSIGQLLRYGYIPDPLSIYSNCRKVHAGELLRIPLDTLGAANGCVDYLESCREAYWKLSDVIKAGSEIEWIGAEEKAIDALDSRLREAVNLRMESDVPLGTLLSGGIDSSLITAIMQSFSHRPVKTFSIGFDEEEYNEARHAKGIAEHLGTEHYELYLKPDDALAVIPDLPRIYDEPFSDVSGIPTYLVSKLARRDVTVVLSGDGGDELFGGYTRYIKAVHFWNKLKNIPLPARKAGKSFLEHVPPGILQGAMKTFTHLFPRLSDPAASGRKLQRWSGFIGEPDLISLYKDVCSFWLNPESVVMRSSIDSSKLKIPTAFDFQCDAPSAIERLMCLDFMTYLPGDILTKVDRASMANSLEARCPFLDKNVMDFAWQLPLPYKLRDGTGKWIVRRLLDRYLPRELVERPKQGFAVPIDNWLRGPLRDWAESLLDEKRLREGGYFNPKPIRKVWMQHIRKDADWQYLLWTVLVFQSWEESLK